MTLVLASTDDLSELADALAHRHEQGLDTYDEWWEGVYRIVTGPSPEHGDLILALGAYLRSLATHIGLKASAPLNIGIDKQDCRVPDIGIYRPDTRRTSPAFLASAELVVEVLSPSEQAGAKLDFYRQWNVREYLEIDASARDVRLLHSMGDGWREAGASDVLGFHVNATGHFTAPSASYLIDWSALD